MRRHGLAGREDLLVAVCLRNPTRDVQLEGHIDGWLLDVAREGGATAVVRRAVLGAASRRITRARDRDQISSFLARFALDRDPAAARALFRMIDRQAPCAAIAQNAIWGLGEEAWRRVIRSYGGRWRAASRLDWGWTVHSARIELGRRRMLAVLAEETDRRPRLQPLADLVRAEDRADRAGYPEPPVDAGLGALERLVRGRRTRKTYWRLRRWGRHASAADRAEAWRRLVAETDGRRILRRLWALRGAPQRMAHARLVQLAEHPVRLVRVNACSRLSEWKSPRVRSLALRLLRDDPRRALDDGVLGLLERNAQERDAATVAAALPPRASAETRDHWVRGVKGIVNPLARGSSKPRSSAVWTPLLVRALDVTPCRECREYVLDLLVERGAATEAILREALFDANDETRATARKALRRS